MKDAEFLLDRFIGRIEEFTIDNIQAKVSYIYRVSQKKGNHLIFRDIPFVFKHKRF
jgi:hypothetical protein